MAGRGVPKKVCGECGKIYHFGGRTLCVPCKAAAIRVPEIAPEPRGLPESGLNGVARPTKREAREKALAAKVRDKVLGEVHKLVRDLELYPGAMAVEARLAYLSAIERLRGTR